MGVSNRDFVQAADGVFPTAAYQVLVWGWAPQVPNAEADVEYGSILVPSDGDWQFEEGSVWAKAIGGGTPTVELQDDGTDITTPTVIVAGTQVAMAEASAPTRLKGGSELQIMVDTSGGSETIDGLVVTVVLRPYPLGEGGQAVT